MSLGELKNICDLRGIKSIAIVDDIFNIPEPDNLDREQYYNFRQRYNTDQDMKQAVASISGVELQDLPGFDDLEEDDLAPLWDCMCKVQLGEDELRIDYIDTLRDLFKKHFEDLNTIVALFSLFHKDLGREVTVHGTDFDAEKVAEAEIVVVDYFLEHNISKDEACEQTSHLVIDVVQAARKVKQTVPSFLLVSSSPDDIAVEEFRKSAKLMKSRFRFFSKEALRTGGVKDMVNLHNLIDASDHTDKIERLIEDWRKGASEAVNSVCKQMLALDVSDLVYLDCFRLMPEGTSIANYLRWFLTASLKAKITGNLTKDLWQEADTLNLFSVVDESGQVDQSALVKTFDGPSDAIARAYCNILFDETRGSGDLAFPAELSKSNLVEGDLFVCTKDSGKEDYEGVEVRLVMTPSCDLISRTRNENPSAKSVLLLPGTMKRVKQGDIENNFAGDFFVSMAGHDEGQLFQIKWDFDHPISVDWSEMCKEGPGGNFRRLGRIRDLYFHRVKEKFTNHFTRIGIAAAPLFPHSRSGKVLIKVGKKSHESVMEFSSEDPFVWEIGPVRVKGESKKKYLYQGSPRFIDQLAEVLNSIQSEDANLADSAKRSAKHLENTRTYMDIQKPMTLGPRGENDVVEFNKVVKHSELTLKSKSDLVIVTFID